MFLFEAVMWKNVEKCGQKNKNIKQINCHGKFVMQIKTAFFLLNVFVTLLLTGVVIFLALQCY